ncbi:MAG: flagellar type III secretion system pore protein FliP [Gammaproteobacteria bacterium]
MKKRKKSYQNSLFLLTGLILLQFSTASYADFASFPAITLADNPQGGKTYSVTLQVLAVMTMLTFLPAILIMMTSFSRIIIVLAMLRQAIGMPTTPTNQILVGTALFLTIFIMAPVFQQIYGNAIQPYLQNKITIDKAVQKASEPLKKFMLSQTRKNDLMLFQKIADVEQTTQLEKIPFIVLIPAFVTSELKTGFQIGFLLFLPFLIIDIVVASVLMSMGMMMLSPLIVSLPFKVMLFVLVDGWTLIIGTLAASFGTI